MVKIRYILVPALAALTLWACKATEPQRSDSNGTPSADGPWYANGGNHPKYPREKYLIGFGSADGTGSDAIADAMQSARDEMAFEIEAQVKTKLESIRKEMRHNEKITLEVNLEARSEQITNEILQGTRRVATHEDPRAGQTQVLVAVSRRAFVDRVLTAAEDALARADASLKAGRQARDAAEPSAALQNALRCLADLTDIERSVARALAVLPSDAQVAQRVRALRTPQLMSEATSILTEIASKLRFEVVSGDGQTGAPGTDLPEPLVARALWSGPAGESPLAGFPVRVELAEGNKATVQAASRSTSQDGTVRVLLRALTLTGDHANPVTLALDMKSLGGDAAADWEQTAAMSYLLPTVASTRVLVAIEETIAGKAGRTPLSQGLIEDKLTTMGLSLVKRDASIKPADLAAMGGADLKRRFGDRADYIITGTVSAAPTGESLGNMLVARSRVSLQAVELLTGRVLALESSDQSNAGKGFAANKRDASRKAIKGAVNDAILPKLLAAFKARLTGGEGWGE